MKQILRALSIAWDDFAWLLFKPENVIETWELHKLKQVPEDYEAFLKARRKLVETGEEQEFLLKSGAIAKVGWF